MECPHSLAPTRKHTHSRTELTFTCECRHSVEFILTHTAAFLWLSLSFSGKREEKKKNTDGCIPLLLTFNRRLSALPFVARRRRFTLLPSLLSRFFFVLFSFSFFSFFFFFGNQAGVACSLTFVPSLPSFFSHSPISHSPVSLYISHFLFPVAFSRLPFCARVCVQYNDICCPLFECLSLTRMCGTHARKSRIDKFLVLCYPADTMTP